MNLNEFFRKLQVVLDTKLYDRKSIIIFDEVQLRQYISDQIQSKRDLDIKLGTTHTGPHRDDIDIKIHNNIPKIYNYYIFY